MISVTPMTNATRAIRKKAKWLSVFTKMAISATRRIANAMFITWRIGRRIGAPDMRPSSLRKAMTEPVNVIAPIAAPSDISTRLPPWTWPGEPMPNACGA